MKYSYNLISEYINGSIRKQEFIDYLELLGLNPVITADVNGDVILELETPANRGDLLSLIGVARDILPFTPYRIQLPDIKFKEVISDRIPVKIENRSDCFYYSCRIMKSLDNMLEHPVWLKESVLKLGYRSSFNVVDISNYVMAETGQPLHIFDLDKIEGGIEIRRAREGEEIVTIDGKKRELDETIMVISDSKKVVAIAGIMGGENSEVKSSTENILIESAVFNPVIVRRGSRKLGLATEASARFERGIDVGTSRTGMSRVTNIISEVCKGKIGPITEEGGIDERSESIAVNKDSISKLAGINVEEDFIKEILNKLNFEVKKIGSVYIVKPPVYREDIKEDVDIIEEIVKYTKYSSVPSEIPSTSIKPASSSKEIEVLERVKDIAVKLGFIEVINMGLTSRENADMQEQITTASIENPLSANLGFLRTSLIPEMLENVKFNINHEVKQFDIFEIGKVYFKEGKSFGEEYRMGFIEVNSGDFLTIKGKVEKLFEKVGLKSIRYENQPNVFSEDENLDIFLAEVRIGNIFIVSSEIKTTYDLKKENIYACEIFLEKLISILFPPDTGFKELPKYPSSKRDFSFILPEKVRWEDIEKVVSSLGLPVEKIDFFDLYTGGNIPKGSISVSFSVVFRLPSRTLQNEEVSEFSEKIIRAVHSELEGRLRGENADI
jgi:phenylalanyl-tRNA synthetase beta chain